MTLSDLWAEYDRLAPSDIPTDWTRKAAARQAIEAALKAEERERVLAAAHDRLEWMTGDGYDGSDLGYVHARPDEIIEALSTTTEEPQ